MSYFNYVQPYEYKHCLPTAGINVYSGSLSDPRFVAFFINTIFNENNIIIDCSEMKTNNDLFIEIVKILEKYKNENTSIPIIIKNINEGIVLNNDFIKELYELI
jgi:hypothetical protein